MCWCFQKLSDDLKDFLKSLMDAITSEAQSKENAGESGDRYSAEAWYTILSGFLAGMTGTRPFTPAAAVTYMAACRVSSGVSPAFFTLNAPSPAAR